MMDGTWEGNAASLLRSQSEQVSQLEQAEADAKAGIEEKLSALANQVAYLTTKLSTAHERIRQLTPSAEDKKTAKNLVRIRAIEKAMGVAFEDAVISLSAGPNEFQKLRSELSEKVMVASREAATQRENARKFYRELQAIEKQFPDLVAIAGANKSLHAKVEELKASLLAAEYGQKSE